MTHRPKKSGWILRLALGLTGLSLWAYLPYRYLARPPAFEGFLGSAYALLFPLSALLALGALAVAWRPELLGRLGDTRLKVVGAYGGAWLLMGFLCLPRLTALSATEPFKGALSTFHMTAQHVFLGALAMASAWRPAEVVAILLGRRRPVESMASEGPLPQSN